MTSLGYDEVDRAKLLSNNGNIRDSCVASDPFCGGLKATSPRHRVHPIFCEDIPFIDDLPFTDDVGNYDTFHTQGSDVLTTKVDIASVFVTEKTDNFQVSYEKKNEHIEIHTQDTTTGKDTKKSYGYTKLSEETVQNLGNTEINGNPTAQRRPKKLKDFNFNNLFLRHSAPNLFENLEDTTDDDDELTVPVSPEVYYYNILGSRIIAQTPGGSTCLPVLTMNLSFCGAGFLGIYHLGVAKALVTHGPKLLLNVQNYTGASAGILVASVLAIKRPDQHIKSIDQCIEFSIDLAEKTKKKKMGALTPGYSLLQPLEKFLDEMTPENGHEIANGRLHVSLTRLRGGKNVIVSHFKTRQHLIQCLLASSYIPFVTGSKIFTIDGQKYIDGGITDNFPRPPSGRTITVSPFCGKEDICPFDERYKRARFTSIGNMSVQLTTDNIKRGYHAFFPPGQEHMEKYYSRGFQDAINFLTKEQFYTPYKGLSKKYYPGDVKATD